MRARDSKKVTYTPIVANRGDVHGESKTDRIDLMMADIGASPFRDTCSIFNHQARKQGDPALAA